ncbi:hypothetical protein GCM10007962_03120 [Yeosuana aromativorans]|uniref:Right handed beta helix domain-containing protein n=1 Tax=Yeosuana aromativorans TaxID=288019 RepID=A0A8J3FE05_9FLAO|nr:right-handed parallel beta-helix repeat-containing protein [Yeosuana aromativorans]GGK12190.1 hypothetical protein GCM10007962_03120 [Yeosuana aromativorans]
MSIKTKFLISFLAVLLQSTVWATDYFVHPSLGNDANTGLSKEQAFKTLSRASTIALQAGDRLFLASNQEYQTGLQLINVSGTKENPIVISTINWDITEEETKPATINFKGESYGILIQDCSYIEVSKIALTANGFFSADAAQTMRCGIMITNKNESLMKHISIKDVQIFDVFYENLAFKRGKEEVKTANGTQKYGWGIRIIDKNPNNLIEDIEIKNCSINSVSHTGIKLTGNSKNISNITIADNSIEQTGGPGIQMSEVKNVHVYKNNVSYSGSDDDSRKWGRGSGLWTWGSSHVLIEKNKFMYANGPGDSAGAHIDFNCDNVVLQYNISAYNAGGFCEILGNNYNCSYRYNISINDGHRVKGVNGAFQEGKIFWLSGFQGEQRKRKGPVNSYFYNNTIYSDSTVVAKIAIDNTSNGILIANNIFYLEGPSKAVLGDQYKPDKLTGDLAKNVFFKNNLFLNKDDWPKEIGIKDIAPIIGNPEFAKKGGLEAKDYIPENLKLILNKGIQISLLPNDSVGLLQSLEPKKDILGNPIQGNPSLGAIEPKIN